MKEKQSTKLKERPMPAILDELAAAATEMDSAAVHEELRRSRRMAVVGRLACSVAHNFNNSLAAIVGFAELTRADLPPGSEAREHLIDLLRSAKESSCLIRRLLDFSRADERGLEEVAVRQVFTGGVAMVRAMLPPNVLLRERMDAPPIRIHASAGQLHEIMLNLAINAVHAVGDKPGRLEMSLASVRLDESLPADVGRLDPGLFVRLSVRDNGCGIDEAILPRIFDQFFSTRSPDEGSGLGLAAVSDAVLAHGGAIRVQSVPGRGTAFHLYFPAPGA